MKIKLLALCIASSFYHPSVMAEEETQTQTEERKSQTVFIDESDDWLQLKSGEVIKGELIGTIKEETNSFDQEIEFDSDDLAVDVTTVYYTHMTLPTNREVKISVVVVTFIQKNKTHISAIGIQSETYKSSTNTNKLTLSHVI